MGRQPKANRDDVKTVVIGVKLTPAERDGLDSLVELRAMELEELAGERLNISASATLRWLLLKEFKARGIALEPRDARPPAGAQTWPKPPDVPQPQAATAAGGRPRRPGSSPEQVRERALAAVRNSLARLFFETPPDEEPPDKAGDEFDRIVMAYRPDGSAIEVEILFTGLIEDFKQYAPSPTMRKAPEAFERFLRKKGIRRRD